MHKEKYAVMESSEVVLKVINSYQTQTIGLVMNNDKWIVNIKIKLLTS